MQLPLFSLLLLGFLAGATIFTGLLAGRLKGFSPVWRSALSMLAAGILAFLLIEIMGQATGQAAIALRGAANAVPVAGLWLSLLLAFGFWLGFVGLVGIEQRLIRGAAQTQPNQLSFMIAIGIGLHNLSEGLAIGQAWLQGMSGLTMSLIVGFALHNATEGFGIVGPAVRRGEVVSWSNIFTLGLIGGGPTFVGTLIGSLWTSPYLSVAVLAMAGGALLYVLKELFASVRSEAKQAVIMTALVGGFMIGWSTEIAAESGLSSASNSPAGQMVEADGDVIAVPQSGLGPHLSAAELNRQNDASNALLHETALTPTILPDGTRHFTLTASVFPWQIYPGVTVQAWGYNNQAPGPLLRLYVGEKVEIEVHNSLPQPTTVHWHGLAVPHAMDGVPDISQPPIPPGGSFTYRFTVAPQMIGTHHYHTHMNDDFQMDQGLNGPLIVDAAPPSSTATETDLLYVIGSFKVGGSEEENAFVLNGKAYPDAPAAAVPLGARVRIRMVNASAEQTHVMHLHGYTFQVVALDGNAIANPGETNTVSLGPSQTADIVFTATNPGRWMFQCHILDHIINPGPNGDGSAAHMADMGGLVTYIDVRPTNGAISPNYVAAGSLMSMSH